MNVFLVGPMGVGKSTIGRKLAQELGRTYVDSDQEIVKRTGADITLIFELEGEQGFRQRETQVLEALSQQDNLIIATGGGVVTQPVNCELMKSNGKTVYLKASVQTLLDRTRHDTSRPLLQTKNRRGRIKEILHQREALYEEAADWVVETDKGSVQDVVAEIMTRLDELNVSGDEKK